MFMCPWEQVGDQLEVGEHFTQLTRDHEETMVDSQLNNGDWYRVRSLQGETRGAAEAHRRVTMTGRFLVAIILSCELLGGSGRVKIQV